MEEEAIYLSGRAASQCQRASNDLLCGEYFSRNRSDSRPAHPTSNGIPPFSFSCELEGPIASLLGTGVLFLVAAFLKAGFLTGAVDLGRAFTPLASDEGLQTPVDAFGVPFGALEKKLRIEPFLDDAALEAWFFNDGGAGVVAPFSFFAMIAADNT